MDEIAKLKKVERDTKYLEQICLGLDAALERAKREEAQEGITSIDIAAARYVIFSDLHKGARNGADDFQVAEQTYNSALAYYFNMGYTLVTLGDVEELWEEDAGSVLKAYEHTISLEAQFHQQGRYYRFWGNHDDAWRFEGPVKQHLVKLYRGPQLKVRECLRLRVVNGRQELGTIVLLHGHQGTLESDRWSDLSRLFVRFVWRPFQRLTKISRNTPAKSWDLREQHNQAMYAWVEKQEKLVLIAGHTHRPVFKSRSHPAKIREEWCEIDLQLAHNPNDAKLREKAALLAAELEWVLAQEEQIPGQEGIKPMTKPCYFNTGCSCFIDGNVTGIEIADGQIRLIRWPNEEGKPKPCTLEHTEIIDVFNEC